MAEFSSGVSGYIFAEGKLSRQGFPIDLNGNKIIACAYCHLYERRDNICFETKEIIFKPQNYIGYKCPYMGDLKRKLNKVET